MTAKTPEEQEAINNMLAHAANYKEAWERALDARWEDMIFTLDHFTEATQNAAQVCGDPSLASMSLVLRSFFYRVKAAACLLTIAAQDAIGLSAKFAAKPPAPMVPREATDDEIRRAVQALLAQLKERHAAPGFDLGPRAETLSVAIEAAQESLFKNAFPEQAWEWKEEEKK
jgi:hypothetical protein